MTKDQALQIVEKNSQYFIQSFVLEDGNLKLSQIYGPFNAHDAERIKSMNSGQREKYKKRQLIEETKNKACMDCRTVKNLNEMTFDHIKGEKHFNIANGCRKSWTQLHNEIEKCEIVCRSCHNVREYLRGVIPRLTNVEDLAELLFRFEK